MTDWEHLYALESDIDARVAGAWEIIWGSELYDGLDQEGRASLASVLRGIYLLGYRDAMIEFAQGTPNVLGQAHNLKFI